MISQIRIKPRYRENELGISWHLTQEILDAFEVFVSIEQAYPDDKVLR